MENLNDIETPRLTNFLPWTRTSPVWTWVTWSTTTETSPACPSTRPLSSASAKMPGSFPTCRYVHFIFIHFPLQLYEWSYCGQTTFIEFHKVQASHSHCHWVSQVCPWTFRKAIKPLLNSILCWHKQWSKGQLGTGVKITCSVTQGWAGGGCCQHLTMKLFVSNVRTHNRCEILCCLIMTNKLNVSLYEKSMKSYIKTVPYPPKMCQSQWHWL